MPANTALLSTSAQPRPRPLPPYLFHFQPSTKVPKLLTTLHRRSTATITMSLSPSPDPLTAAARFLWGRSLPPQLLISTVRTAWSASWHLMMRQLAPSTPSGSYSRPASPFPSVPDEYRHSAASGRLHLYVGMPCPSAHRVLLVRALKNLESLLPVSVAAPSADGGWEFTAEMPDRANGRRTLREVYSMRRGGYDGRSTVPMLWDKEKGEVVCNESYGIIEFLNSGFTGVEDSGGIEPDLAPPELKGRIEEWNRIIYPKINNGVYRCGFAQSQEAYDVAIKELFETLDLLDAHLATSRYLCGDILTLADVCLFTTLIRFDIVYNILFKCTEKKLIEYPNLHGYLRDIFQIRNVAGTCNFEAIMDGYYRILFPLNPGSIRPVIPSDCKPECLNKPHGRESLSFVTQTR